MAKKKRQSLNPLREQLAILVNQANSRVYEINDYNANHKKPIVSRAVEEGKRTLLESPSRLEELESGTLFNANLKSRKQIMREFSRVQNFLSDYTSTIEGSKKFNSELQSLSGLRGAFGGEWEAETGKTYDTSRIDEDIAKNTFQIYNRIVSRAGGWERAIGFAQGKESLIGYGSENLIIAIYDMVAGSEQQNIDWEAVWSGKGDKKDTKQVERILNLSYQMIQDGIDNYEEMERNQVADYDYGVLFDDEDAKARRSYYAWRWDYRQKVKTGGKKDVGWF